MGAAEVVAVAGEALFNVVMRRGRHGAGWRPRVRDSADGLLEVQVEAQWRPTRDAAALDSGLSARLRSALFELDGSGLHRSIRIPPGGDEDWQKGYVGLVGALGGPSQLVIGWWVGEARDAVDFLGPPSAEVPLERGTDLDLVVWRVGGERLQDVLGTCGVPTLLATTESGWVLIAPPATDDMFLYPEISASGE